MMCCLYSTRDHHLAVTLEHVYSIEHCTRPVLTTHIRASIACLGVIAATEVPHVPGLESPPPPPVTGECLLEIAFVQSIRFAPHASLCRILSARASLDCDLA